MLTSGCPVGPRIRGAEARQLDAVRAGAQLDVRHFSVGSRLATPPGVPRWRDTSTSPGSLITFGWSRCRIDGWRGIVGLLGLAVSIPHSTDRAVSIARSAGCRAADHRLGSRPAIRRHRPGAAADHRLADRPYDRGFSSTTSDSSAVGQGEPAGAGARSGTSCSPR